MSVPCQECERSYICVLWVSICPISTIFRLDFELFRPYEINLTRFGTKVTWKAFNFLVIQLLWPIILWIDDILNIFSEITLLYHWNISVNTLIISAKNLQPRFNLSYTRMSVVEVFTANLRYFMCVSEIHDGHHHRS